MMGWGGLKGWNIGRGGVGGGVGGCGRVKGKGCKWANVGAQAKHSKPTNAHLGGGSH